MLIDLFTTALTYTFSEQEDLASLKVWAMNVTQVDRHQRGHRMFVGKFLNTTAKPVTVSLSEGEVLLFFTRIKIGDFFHSRAAVCRLLQEEICPILFAEGEDWDLMLRDDVVDMLGQNSSLVLYSNEELIKEIVRRKVI